ncbi:MAG: hypothetical protein ACYC91_09855 [Solirubrobacteraceae bacterium]
MLLRHRIPGIEQRPAARTKSLEHLDEKSVGILRWLAANRVDFVLVGPVARAIRGETSVRGPVSVVPAPYGRNLDRLSRALWAAHARLRVDLDHSSPGGADTVPVKMTAEKLVRAQRWTLRCGEHDLDIEGRPAGAPRYQELLYEAMKFHVGDALSVEVASPEDIELYEHVRRTGVAPEIRITRQAREPT